jgi:hypothetical protein
MKESPGALELLASRVDELEKRVHALEHPNEARTSAMSQVAAPFSSAELPEEVDFQTGNLFPTLGRAMLGIAGAYLLRAVAQAGLMPKAAVAVAGIVYAAAWLVWAARSPKVSRLVQIVYAGTSVFILLPMLWEVTLYFHAFSPIVTAGVLATFAVLGTFLVWGSERSIIVWFAHGSAAISAAALTVATHQVLPFVYLLLITVLLNEYAKTTGYRQGLAALVSLTADAAIWGMIFIYSGPQNAHDEYPELASAALIFPACLLFAINGTGAAIRIILREQRISIFDVIQTMIAFLLAVASVLYFAPPRGNVILGISCLLLSGALYTAIFRQPQELADPRNFRVLGAWSAALLLAGMLWALPRPTAAIALACAAVVAYLPAARMKSTMLDLHGAVFLTTAAGISVFPEYVFGALAGSLPGRPAAIVVIVTCCAAVAFVVARGSEAGSWQKQALEFVPALVGMCGLTALLARSVLAAAALVTLLDVHHIAFLRTLTVSLVALALAFAGSRAGRAALTQLGYLALAFLAAKLLFEDLRHGRMEFIAGSIFLFAMTLIAVPRLVRLGARLRANVQAGVELQSTSLGG